MSWSALDSNFRTSASVNSSTYGFDSNVVALNAGESAVIQIAGTCGAGPTDDLNFQVLASNDGGTTFDTMPYMSGSLGKVASATARRTVTVYGVPHFKMQFARTGTTDTITTVATCKKDGISA